ncbi:MAG: P-loop NTPase [Candidatus Polarisedimenticolaceae bacterium]|nr:P-loop NTPase [Candidatus Polarisedimenticolaceae bacterium]
MTILISVGSGKGGSGKSFVAVNLASSLAAKGKHTVLIDLDIGGANDHILFGLLNPTVTLEDFLSHKVKSLEEIIQPIAKNLGLIAGAGNNLQTANMPYATKGRLMRHVMSLDADIVIIDIGAGSHYSSLDFFMFADHQICVTTPEPAAVLDLFRFIKLAMIRKMMSAFIAHNQVSKALRTMDFDSKEAVLDFAEEREPGCRDAVAKTVEAFAPHLVVNRVVNGRKLNIFKLVRMLHDYMGVALPGLTEIPEDEAVLDAVCSYLPVVSTAPLSPASVSIDGLADKLLKHIGLA